MYLPIHVMNKNTRSAYIAAWQQFLKTQGYYTENIDGLWGGGCIKATGDFQGRNQLNSDGKPGHDTFIQANKKYGFDFSPIKNLEIPGHSNIIIDVSHYQKYNPRTNTDSICFENAYQDGIRAVIHKCTERGSDGENATDPTYIRRVAKAKAAGLRWGAYHFGGQGSGIGQAEYFLSVVGQHEDTILVLDWEVSSMPIKEAVNFISTIFNKTGKYPLLYSRTNFINNSGAIEAQLAVLANCPFWVSNYQWKVTNPELPSSWSKYAIWQFSDNQYGHGAVPVQGIGNCDRSMFNGIEADLATFWAANQY